EVSGRGNKAKDLLSFCNRDLIDDGKFGFVVNLGVRHENHDYEIVREVDAKTDRPKSDDDFSQAVSMRRGGVVLGPAECRSLLKTMLPKDIARFFLFDGELLAQYEELLISESETGRGISEAIEKILGVPILKNARDHLAQLASEASKASAKEASKHKQTQAMGLALASANDQKEAHEAERDRQREELEALTGKRDEILEQLKRQERFAAAVKRLDIANADLEAATKKQEVKASELKEAMSDAWRTLLIKPVSKVKASAKEAAESEMARMVRSLRLKAIEESFCETCDRDIPTDVRERLIRATADSDSESGSVGFGRVTDALALSEFKEVDVRREIQHIWRDLAQAKMEESHARGRIEDENKILDQRDPDEVRRDQASLSNIEQKKALTAQAVEDEQQKVDEANDQIANLTRKLAAKGSPELATFQLRERVLEATKAVFADAVERFKAELRRRVEKTATDLFLQMTTEEKDYDRLMINDQYGLSIVHSDGKLEDGRSAGAEQVVALALMGALQANAPLSGPIVMDTPFGRLDNHVP
ncbi:MAG: hypothetical protein AAF357_17510, partial [Verrucomicrobiota bacterium]